MNARLSMVVALSAAVTLTSVAAGGPGATRQRVAIDMKIAPKETFVLAPLKAGAVKADSGRITNVTQVLGTAQRTVMRDGQTVTIYYPAIWKLEGKRGTITLRERIEDHEVGSDVNGDAFPDSVGFGTWKVVRGTGEYAGITGRGRSAHMGLGNRWVARYEGFLTVP